MKKLSTDRFWCVVVKTRGKKLTLPVCCGSMRVAETVALNVSRYLPAVKKSVGVVEVPSAVDPSWPVWSVVTSRRMTVELERIARQVVRGLEELHSQRSGEHEN